MKSFLLYKSGSFILIILDERVLGGSEGWNTNQLIKKTKEIESIPKSEISFNDVIFENNKNINAAIVVMYPSTKENLILFLTSFRLL